MDWFSLGLRLAGVLFAFGGLSILFFMMWNAVRPRTPKVVAPEPVSLPGGSVALLPAATVQAQLAEAMQSTRSREEMEALVRDELRAELRTEIETQVRSEVTAEVDAELQAKREELEQKRLEQERKRQQDELLRAAEEAKQMAVKREQMREALAKLATTKPDAMAEVVGAWLEQSRASAAPAPRRATSAIN